MQSFEEYRDQFIKASMEGQNSIGQAKRDAEAQDLIIFVPNINAYSEEELDELYDKYMGMTKPFRRKADWITLQYFGMSNQTLYEIMKSIKLLDNKRPDVSMNNASGSSDDPIFLESSDDPTLEAILEFNKKMNQFHYGLARNGKVPPDKTVNTTVEDYNKYWKMASPEQFEKQNGGICWDFVTYQADYFKKHFKDVLRVNTFIIIWDKGPDYPTHTFMLFDYKGRTYHFESSFGKIQGVWEGNQRDLFSHIIDAMNEDPNKYDYAIKPYDALDNSLIGMNCEEYMNYMYSIKASVNHTFSKNYKVNKIESAPINEMYMDDMPDATDHPNIRYVSAADDINVGNVLNDFSPTPAQIKDAEAWEKKTDFILMPLHTETLGILEKYWDLFNLMTHKHRRVSDWKCQEIFGTTNMQFYLWIKSTFNKEHDNRMGNVNIYEYSLIRRYVNRLVEEKDRMALIEGLVNLAGISGNYDSIVAGDIISDAISKYDGLSPSLVSPDINMNDLPMYTPDEIDDGIKQMNPDLDATGYLMEKWLKEYKQFFETGVASQEFKDLNKARVKELNEIHNGFVKATHYEILQCGWSPYVEFSGKNRALADRRIKAILRNKHAQPTPLKEADEKLLFKEGTEIGNSHNMKMVREWANGTKKSNLQITIDLIKPINQ